VTDRRTDRQTDGIPLASTALCIAGRAVKNEMATLWRAIFQQFGNLLTMPLRLQCSGTNAIIHYSTAYSVQLRHAIDLRFTRATETQAYNRTTMTSFANNFLPTRSRRHLARQQTVHSVLEISLSRRLY